MATKVNRAKAIKIGKIQRMFEEAFGEPNRHGNIRFTRTLPGIQNPFLYRIQFKDNVWRIDREIGDAHWHLVKSDFYTKTDLQELADYITFLKK